MSGQKFKVAVLISGTGSNLKALIEAVSEKRLALEICLVISNRASAAGLDHARQAQIPIAVIDKTGFAGNLAQDREIVRALGQVSPDLVLLAGYMRVLGAGPVNAYRGRMINLHPSLLPRFPGLHTYQRVLEAGDTEHGGSIHFVTTELDGGPVISQVRIPVQSGDTAEALAARLSPREHQLLLATMELFTRRRVKMFPGGVMLDDSPLTRPLLLNSKGLFD